jgi:hypothetical protein
VLDHDLRALAGQQIGDVHAPAVRRPDAAPGIVERRREDLAARRVHSCTIRHMYPVGPRTPSTSGLAIAGFVCSFFCGLLGLILSILGLNEIGTSNGTIAGRGFAIAGIVLSILHFLVGIALAGFLVFAARKGIEEVHAAVDTSSARLQLEHRLAELRAGYAESNTLPVGTDAPDLDVRCDRNKPPEQRVGWHGDGKVFDEVIVVYVNCNGHEPSVSLHVELRDGRVVGTIESHAP